MMRENTFRKSFIFLSFLSVRHHSFSVEHFLVVIFLKINIVMQIIPKRLRRQRITGHHNLRTRGRGTEAPHTGIQAIGESNI